VPIVFEIDDDDADSEGTKFVELVTDKP